MDPGESIGDAAAREAFEEMGIVDGLHLERVAELEEPNRYAAGGWLAKEGFAGQELRFVLFRCVDPVLDGDNPAVAVDLKGRGGEPPEFGRVRWQDPFSVADAVRIESFFFFFFFF